MREQRPAASKGMSGGKKVLIVMGILLMVCGVFLGAFSCSFQMMIQAASDARSQEDQNALATENQQLRDNVQLLEDRISVLEGELERYQKATPTASAAPKATGSSGTSTSRSSSSGSSSGRSSGTGVSRSSSSGSASSRAVYDDSDDEDEDYDYTYDDEDYDYDYDDDSYDDEDEE